jgi:hypothetical protein
VKYVLARGKILQELVPGIKVLNPNSRRANSLYRSDLRFYCDYGQFLAFFPITNLLAWQNLSVMGGILSGKFDIFLRLPDGQPIWIKAVESLEEARRQMMQLNERDPGEYFIFNALSGRVVVS